MSYPKQPGQDAEAHLAVVHKVMELTRENKRLKGQVQQWMEHGNVMQKAGHEMMLERDAVAKQGFLYGYQQGHEDTVEGCFTLDPDECWSKQLQEDVIADALRELRTTNKS